MSGLADDPELLNLFDFAARAARRLPKPVLDYYRGFAADGVTLRANREAFERRAIHYRVLAGVGERALGTEVLGQPSSMPVLLAPSAFHRLAHDDGELATVRAAGAAGVPMILSTMSTVPMEEVVAAATAPVWFQLYVYKDRGATEALVQRAEAAGCGALVFTVDAPLLGNREQDRRNRFGLPAHITAPNVTGLAADRVGPGTADSGLSEYFHDQLDPNLTLADIGWLRSITSLPVVVKGVCRPDDAVSCAEAGASAVVVSNHGGRQLDTAPATLDVLEPVVQALRGRAEVWLDGGVRRGTDVVKALALGAKAVLLGRPVLWGLAVGGEAGVKRVLDIIRDELDLALALSGCPSAKHVPRDLLA